jgi:pheromone shutdown protein TraB
MVQIEMDFGLDCDDRELDSDELVTERANLPDTLAAWQQEFVKPEPKPVRVIVDERPSTLAPRRLDVQRMISYAATRAQRLG